MYKLVLILLSALVFSTDAQSDNDPYDDIIFQEILDEIENGNFDWLAETGENYNKIPKQEIHVFDNVADFQGNTLDSISENELNADVLADDIKASADTSPEDAGPAAIRDPEYESQNAKGGYQYVSGGDGEVDSEGNVKVHQEVKTDEGLPAYCNPPNPCPKGKTSKYNCQETAPDTANFNRRYVQWQMRRGDCGCDTEHMYPASCPKGAEKISSQPSDMQEDTGDDMDSLIEHMLGISTEDNNPFVSQGEKRAKLVAKKGSYHRNTRGIHGNPYLEGEKLRTVAKKAPPMTGKANDSFKSHPLDDVPFSPAFIPLENVIDTKAD